MAQPKKGNAMKKTITKTYREQEINVVVFADLQSLRDCVGDDAILNLYQEYYLARTVGSKVDAAIEKGETLDAFDLTAHMPKFGSRESGPRDGMSKFKVLAKSLLGSKATAEEIDSKAAEIKAKLLG